MNKLTRPSRLTFLDRASLEHVAGGAQAGSSLNPVEDIGPRVREETGPDGEPVLVRIWY